MILSYLNFLRHIEEKVPTQGTHPKGSLVQALRKGPFLFEQHSSNEFLDVK